MSLKSFDGETFVAFIDISGFKKLMEEKKAKEALDTFYSIGYDAIRRNKYVEGLFISDSGILFVRNKTDEYNLDNNDSLKHILSVIQEINKKMLRDEYILITSVAFGEFSYSETNGFTRIEKNKIIGEAYLNAYLDTERKKKEPGTCRILVQDVFLRQAHIQELNCVIKKSRNVKFNEIEYSCYYYYWNLDNKKSLQNFKKKYKHYLSPQYSQIINLLRNKAHESYKNRF